jgi:hypothetical protein
MGFATELKALLIKYNATIEADYDGDSHGINNEKIVVTDNTGATLLQSEYGFYLDATDIEDDQNDQTDY